MSSCRLPRELCDLILGLLSEDDSRDAELSMRACALVNTTWTRRSQAYLFNKLVLHDNFEWRRLHKLLRDTAPHLRRLVRQLDLFHIASTEAGALDWTDLLPLLTRVAFTCSPPDLAFMTQVPSLCDLHVSCSKIHGMGEDDWEVAFFKAAVLHLPADAHVMRLPHQVVRVSISQDTPRSVQMLVLYWVLSTHTYPAQSFRRVDLVIFPERDPALMQRMFDDNRGIEEVGLFLLREPGLVRITACVLRLTMHALSPGLRMALGFLRTAAFPALRVLELKFQGSLSLPHFDPFEGSAASGTADDEEYAIPAALAAQVRSVTVILDSVQVLYHTQRFLQLFHEVDRLQKLSFCLGTDLRKEDCAGP